MISLENKIISLLQQHSEGLKAREIADAIPGTDKKSINQVLYGVLKNKCVQDESYRWRLKTMQDSELHSNNPPVSVKESPVSITMGSEKAVRCPKCGALMVKRIAQKGYNRGGEFWGCSNYPKCKGTRTIKPVDDSPGTKTPLAPAKPISRPGKSKAIKFCEECIVFINDECDGKGNANRCPAYKFGG